MDNKIIIKKVSTIESILDKLIFPIMIVLGKFNVDSINETHPWHIQKIDLNPINLSMTIKMLSNDNSIHKKRHSFLSHSPLLGGWIKYSIYEVSAGTKLPFFVGWIDHKKSKAFLNRLPIYDRKVRLLNGTNLFDISAFAISSEGTQIPISKVGEGKLGTNADKNIRLL